MASSKRFYGLFRFENGGLVVLLSTIVHNKIYYLHNNVAPFATVYHIFVFCRMNLAIERR